MINRIIEGLTSTRDIAGKTVERKEVMDGIRLCDCKKCYFHYSMGTFSCSDRKCVHCDYNVSHVAITENVVGCPNPDGVDLSKKKKVKQPKQKYQSIGRQICPYHLIYCEEENGQNKILKYSTKNKIKAVVDKLRKETCLIVNGKRVYPKRFFTTGQFGSEYCIPQVVLEKIKEGEEV